MPIAQDQIENLYETIYQNWGYDFRDYAFPSLLRRTEYVLERYGVNSLQHLQEKICNGGIKKENIIPLLTVPTTDFFRDPDFFSYFRFQIVPRLKTYPYPRIWIPGCSTGEELISYCIILKEENLLERTTLFATDINMNSLQTLKNRSYSTEKIKKSMDSYCLSGGRENFQSYYQERYGCGIFDQQLFKTVVIAEHCLATADHFSMVDMISCRNTVIYFNKKLQRRVFDLFHKSLDILGVLATGTYDAVSTSTPSESDSCFKVMDHKNFYLKVKNNVGF